MGLGLLIALSLCKLNQIKFSSMIIMCMYPYILFLSISLYELC